MQTLSPVTPIHLLEPVQTIVQKFEVYDGSDWVNLSDFYEVEGEILDNGNLEDWASSTSLNDWDETIYGGSTINRESTTVHRGNYSCRFDISASNGYAYESQDITLVADGTYEIAFWYKTEAGKTGMIQLCDSTQTVYLQDDMTWDTDAVIVLAAATEWTRAVFRFEAHSSYTSYRFRFGNRGAADATDSSLYFDTFSFRGVPTNYVKSMSCSVAGAGKDTEPLAGNWSVSLDNVDGIFHPYHPTSSVADLIQLGRKVRLSWGIAYQPNALTDGDVEDWTTSSNLTSWTEYTAGSSTIAQESTTVHDGSYSVHLSIDGSNNEARIRQQVTLTPGLHYQLSFWYKTEAAKKMDFQLLDTGSNTWLQSDGSWGSDTNIEPDASTSWAEYIISFVAPAAYTTYYLYIGHETGAASSSSIYFDNVRIQPIYEVPLTKYWQQVTGYMDTPRFKHSKSTISVSGTDYMKALADTKLYSPNTAWGSSETFSTTASPGGTGSELYGDSDAVNPTTETNGVSPWSEGASGGATSSQTGSQSTYCLRFTRDGVGPTEQYTENSGIFTMTDGLQYTIEFWARVQSGTNYARLIAYCGGTYLGEKNIQGDSTWRKYSMIVTATSTAGLKLRLSTGGKYATATDAVELDEVSVKAYDDGSWMRYDLSSTCEGVYYATLDGVPIWHGDEDGFGGWHYEDTGGTKTFWFSQDMVVNAGTDNLVIYYYTETDIVDVVADLLVAAGLYASQSAAKTAMNYTDPNIDITKVWFDPGTSALDAIRLICERANYRFWFDYSGDPNFEPAPTLATPADFIFTSPGDIQDVNLFQDINEVRNHIIITGAERAVEPSVDDLTQSHWTGDLSDQDSIDAYLEKTHQLNNHLFTDQDSIDVTLTALLAYYKEPKFYVELSLSFCPVPIEVGDTVTIPLQYAQGLTVTKHLLIRSINYNNDRVRFTGEVHAPFDSTLVVQAAAFTHIADDVPLLLPGILDPADCAFALVCDNVVLDAEVIYEYTTAQNGTPLEVPTGYTQAILECWGTGAEGGGGDGNANGGGGGGAYSKTTLSVTSGDTFYLYLSAPGGTLNDTKVVLDAVDECVAECGAEGDDLSGGQGGQASSGTGDTKYSGGDGDDPGTYTGGGGGGSAGTGSDGNDATSQTGAAAVTGGGPGGNGGNRYADGSAPSSGPGGGGGGSGEDSGSPKDGGLGAIGKIKITLGYS